MPPQSHKQVVTCAAIIAAAMMVAGCGKNQDLTGWWQGEQQRIELSHQLELKKYRFEQVSSHDFEQLESLRRSTAKAGPMLEALRRQRLTLSDQIELLNGQWVGFRESKIRDQRQHAMRKTFEKLTLASGRTFVEASVASIDDSGVTIRHADGSARLRFADLDDRQRIFFGLEADLSRAAEEQEARDLAAYESWVDKRLMAIDEKKTRDAENASREESASRQTRAMLAAELVTASNARSLAQPAANVSSRSWSYSNYRTYRPTYRYVYYNNTPDYTSQPAASVYSCRVTSPDVCTPPVVTNHGSFADTTIPSIP